MIVQVKRHAPPTHQPRPRVRAVEFALIQQALRIGKIGFGALTMLGGRCEKRHVPMPSCPGGGVGTLKQRVHPLEVTPNRLGKRLPRFLKRLHQAHHLALTACLQGCKPWTERLLDPFGFAPTEVGSGLLHVFQKRSRRRPSWFVLSRNNGHIQAQGQPQNSNPTHDPKLLGQTKPRSPRHMGFQQAMQAQPSRTFTPFTCKPAASTHDCMAGTSPSKNPLNRRCPPAASTLA